MDNRQIVINNARVGDILLSIDKKSPISQIIAGMTKGNWSHVSLYVGDDKLIESTMGGTQIIEIDHYLNDESRRVGLFRVTPKLTEREKALLVKKARRMLMKPYAYIQLIWYWFLRVIGKSEDKRWAVDLSRGVVCSEMVAKVYQKIGRPIKDLLPEQMEPVDFDESSVTVRIA